MPWASSPYSQDSSTEISFSFSPSKTTSQPPTFVRGHWHVPLCTSADGSWGKPIWKIPAPNSMSCPSLMALIWACPLLPKEPILTKCGKKIVSSVFPSLLLSVAETSWLSKAYLSLKKKSLFHKESSNVFFSSQPWWWRFIHVSLTLQSELYLFPLNLIHHLSTLCFQ